MLSVTSAPDLLKTKNGNCIFMIPADYLKCNFSQLKAECQDPANHGTITWKDIACANVGDVIYLYYKNLPSPNGDNQQRILMRGVITDTTHPVPRYLIENTDSCEMAKGVSIGELQPISLKNESKFSCETLQQQYKVYNFHKHRFTVDDKALFDALEEEANHTKELVFQDLIDYFQTPCVFQDSMHPKNLPLTFMRRNNGLLYYERHHVIPQNAKRKIHQSQFDRLVDHPENQVNLCPLCHARIHKGSREDVEKMVEYLYADKKAFFEQQGLSSYVGDDVLGWLKSVYRAL